MRLIMFFCFCYLPSTFLYAQIDESDTVKYRLRIGVTGIKQTGNVEYLAIRSKLDYGQSLSKKLYFKTQNNFLYQEFFGRKADSDIYSRNYLYLNPQERVYAYIIGYISENFRRKIDTRYFVGGGFTYQLVQKPEHVLKLSANTVYEKTKFRASTFNLDDYHGLTNVNLWRGTIYANGLHRFYEKRLTIFYDYYYQYAFKDSKNYRYQFELGIDWKLLKGLSLNISYGYTHESLVVDVVKSNDGILTFGLSYSTIKF